MNREQALAMQQEIQDIIRPILVKYRMTQLPSFITWSNDEFKLSIHGSKMVTLDTALFADDVTLKHGFARPGSKAWITDRGRRRRVIITDAKVKKYGFYFADDLAKQSMIGHFNLFSENE